jgi:hypothetical protein
MMNDGDKGICRHLIGGIKFKSVNECGYLKGQATKTTRNPWKFDALINYFSALIIRASSCRLSFDLRK